MIVGDVAGETRSAALLIGGGVAVALQILALMHYRATRKEMDALIARAHARVAIRASDTPMGRADGADAVPAQ